MFLVWIGVTLLLLHVAGVAPFADWKWYWLMLPFGLALVWFEVFERVLGLDKKKGLDDVDKAKRKRIQKSLGDHAQEARKGRSRR